MALKLTLPETDELKPRITVFGVGGAGGNAVNNMIEKALEGVDFVTANTDAQALSQSRAPNRIQMGVKVTEGLGAGARPSVGAAAAEETIEEIVDHLAGAHMCFITAGMGGGTGTGAAPIIAQAARELGVLTVGVVTKPFQFEGARRMRQAEEGVERLQKVVDTLIIIPNQNLFRLANEKTTFTDAFSMADDVLYQGVKGVTDLMVRPGLINLDFADVRAVMDEMGKAMMGTGEAEGEDRAIQAAEKAIANPLLDEISLRGAKGVLINITGAHDLTLFELDEAANRIREEVDPDANIIVGSTLDPAMEGRMRVSVVATGIDASEAVHDVPVPRRTLSRPLEPRAEAAPQPAARSSAPADGFRPAPEPVSAARDTDDLPPPAYREAPVEEAVPLAAVEPEPAPRGAATPEAVSRLQAAVSRARPEPAAEPAPERSRLSIGGFISRMSGHHAEPERPTRQAEPPRAAEPAPRRAEPAPPAAAPRAGAAGTAASGTGGQGRSAYRPAARSDFEDEQENDRDQDRIEIPAFLRRQAN